MILCAGVLEDRKGQDVLIDALAGLRDRGLEARLVLVGDGPQRSSLEEQVRTRGISAQVRFTGRLESIDGELSVADILAVPSRIEGLPFVILEGMAAGIAVLASSLPGIEEVVSPGRTGILAAPGNSTAWTDALARLMTDPATSARLAAEGRREFEKRFTLQRMVRETTSVYEEALG